MKERVFPLLLSAALCCLSGLPAFPCTADSYEEDDACIPSKTVIYGGDTQSHNFCTDAEDWINFNACTGRTYTIETSNLGTSTDTVLELYNTDCASLLTSDNDGGAGSASKIAGWVAPADGTYHVKVLQFDGTFGDNREYDITLTGDTSICAKWARSFNGGSTDRSHDILQTFDGGFLSAGESNNLITKGYDAWILKLSPSGIVEWEKYYGGTGDDVAYSAQQLTDGSFIIAGYTESFGAVGKDFWVFKLDVLGNIVWQKIYGVLDDIALSVREAPNNELIVAGYSTNGPNAYWWVMKLTSGGSVVWEKNYIYDTWGSASSARALQGGQFMLAGTTFDDGWVLKVNSSGNILWQKKYETTLANYDTIACMEILPGGGMILAGRTESGAANYDFWVLKLSSSGSVQWQKSYGGAFKDVAQSIHPTFDGGFVVTGWTFSFGSGTPDFTNLWILKLDSLGNVVWQKTYGGANQESGSSIKEVVDGGFIVGVTTRSFGAGDADVWLLRLDQNGDIDASCTFIEDTSVSGVNPGGTVINTGESPFTTTALTADTLASINASSATVYEQCPCPTFTVAASADSASVCLGTSQTYTATPAGGFSPFTYEWDFSYDGVTFNTEGTGNPVTYTQPAVESYTVRVRVTDSCSFGPTVAFADVPVTVNPFLTPAVAYDSSFDPVATLTEVCGDGDLVIESVEIWSVTVQLVNNAPGVCDTANNTVANLPVNSSFMPCNNPGIYGSIPAGGTAQFTYSLMVDGPICTSDVTFDVTGIASDEGTYPDEIAAFTVPQSGQTETGTQVTDPLTATNETISSDFAPAFSLPTPAAAAMLPFTLTGTTDLVNCVEVALVDPFGTATVVKPLGGGDANPYDVTAFYTGPGTYQLRLMEEAKGCGGGGYAQLASGALYVLWGCNFVTGCSCPPPPLEPSPVGSPDPLFIPTTAADQIIVEDVANESGYVVYEEAIGTWYGTPSQGCLWGTDVVDLGATVQLNYLLGAGDRWVVVSAASAAGESSCGMDSAGAERNEAPGWPAPGPCP